MLNFDLNVRRLRVRTSHLSSRGPSHRFFEHLLCPVWTLTQKPVRLRKNCSNTRFSFLTQWKSQSPWKCLKMWRSFPTSTENSNQIFFERYLHEKVSRIVEYFLQFFSLLGSCSRLWFRSLDLTWPGNGVAFVVEAFYTWSIFYRLPSLLLFSFFHLTVDEKRRYFPKLLTFCEVLVKMYFLRTLRMNRWTKNCFVIHGTRGKFLLTDLEGRINAVLKTAVPRFSYIWGY